MKSNKTSGGESSVGRRELAGYDSSPYSGLVFPLGEQLCGEKELGSEAPKLLESCPLSPCEDSVWFPDCQDWNIGRVQPLGDWV